MERTQCTGLAGVPETFHTLLRNSTFPQRRFPNLRKIQQAGGKLSSILIEELCQAVADAEIFIMYGQTEATARLSYLPPELLKSKKDSIGKGIPGVELKVLNQNGDSIRPGEIGEIVAKGQNIALGYFNDPETTAGKFVNGSLLTGDLATIDRDGFIYIVDRKSDFIKPHGYRVSSQQIEANIMELPDVVSAAVIGVPDLAIGEEIRAFVVLANGSTRSRNEIIAHCKHRMPSFMVPRSIFIVDSLPLNESGKVVKSLLRKHAVESCTPPISLAA